MPHVFALGVVAMMVAMFFGMSRSLGTLSTPWSWIANAALLMQFPVVHPLLLTGRGRAVLSRLAPGGMGSALASTTYVAIAGLQVSALFALWSPTGIIWWEATGPTRVVLISLYSASWVGLGKAMSDAGLALQTGSLGWMALFRGQKAVYPKMPDRGLFKFTRQPIYVAFALTLWTVPTWTPDQLMVAVVFTAYCLFAPLHKEARFRRIYGSAFETYASGVPYWLPWPRKQAQKQARKR